MKWSSKSKSGPEIGAKRERVVFAFIPRLCVDSYWRWLEYVIISEEFCKGYVSQREYWMELSVREL